MGRYPLKNQLDQEIKTINNAHKKRPGEIEGDSIYTQALCSTSYVTSNLAIKTLFQNIKLSFSYVITFFNNNRRFSVFITAISKLNIFIISGLLFFRFRYRGRYTLPDNIYNFPIFIDQGQLQIFRAPVDCNF